MHWTREGQRDPDAVEDVTIREDPDVDIVDEDVVKVASLLVPKECVRHPNLLRVSQGEILYPSWNRKHKGKTVNTYTMNMCSNDFYH